MNTPISASQLELFKVGARRWAFTYLQGLREEAGPAADAGKAVHAYIERYYSDESIEIPSYSVQKYNPERLAEKMLQHLPKKEGLPFYKSEIEFGFDGSLVIDGVAFKGIIDLLTADTVYDHKTTSSMKWAKSTEALTTNIQRLLYVAAFPGTRRTQWTYGAWDTYEAEPRSLDVDPAKDRERFKLYVLTPAEELLKISPGVDPLSLPECDLTSCRLYPPKGCPFKDKCFPKEKKKTMRGILEKLEAEEKKEIVPPAPAPAPAPAVETVFCIDTLYVDCLPLTPLNPPLVYAHTLLRPAGESVAADLELHHPLLADYGKGPGFLAAQVADDLRKNPVTNLFLETKSAEGRAVMQTLLGLARVSIKGVF